MAAEIFPFHDTALIVFARHPSPGKVKTRLAAAVGAERAAMAYRACAEHVFEESRNMSGGVRKYVFYSELEERHAVEQWSGGGFEHRWQGGGDLGERMRNAFESVFREGAKDAIIVGTDVPDISAAILDESAVALCTNDAVLGPATDGGYYLLGTKRLYPEIFSGIAWGSDGVFEATMRALDNAGLSVHLLPALMDIDTADDLRLWMESASRRHVCHPLLDVARMILTHG